MSDDIRKHSSRSHSPSNHRHSKSSKRQTPKHHSRRHKKSSKRSRSRSHSSSNSRSRSRDYSKHKKPKKCKKHSRSRHRSPSSSYSYDTASSDNSDTSISSSSESHHKKHRKKSSKKKHRKHKHSKKKKRHKHKHKHSKHKKLKKKHKKCNKSRDKTLLEGNLAIYRPSEYREGEHGFITPNDLINKMPELTCWLADIHGVAIDNLVKRDERKWFAKFCDDWNTSTMADDKYYDIDKWNKANGGGDNEAADRNYGMSDEQALHLEKRAARQSEQDRRYAARVQEMKKHLIELKSHNKKEFESLTDQHIPRKETFESLAAKRKAKKVEDRVKRFGKYNTNVSWD